MKKAMMFVFTAAALAVAVPQSATAADRYHGSYDAGGCNSMPVFCREIPRPTDEGLGGGGVE